MHAWKLPCFLDFTCKEHFMLRKGWEKKCHALSYDKSNTGQRLFFSET